MRGVRGVGLRCGSSCFISCGVDYKVAESNESSVGKAIEGAGHPLVKCVVCIACYMLRAKPSIRSGKQQRG